MRSAPQIAVMLAATLAAFAPANADELQMPASTSASSGTPSRGMSMEKVEAAYGAPSNRESAIGQPPITRWEYPAYVVYFENNIVLHTVVKS
jgi:hypothetical protein